MAKKQSRRSVSLNRAVFDAAVRQSAAVGLSCSEYITQLIRTAIPDLPDTRHLDKATGEYKGGAQPVRAPVAPQFHRMTPTAVAQVIAPRRVTKEEIAIAEIKRRAIGVPAGALCANCVEFKATHMGHVDRTGTVYPLCDACELPKESVA